jgi:hypothetical protein
LLHPRAGTVRRRPGMSWISPSCGAACIMIALQVQSYLEAIRTSHGIYMFRWGDAPIHTFVSTLARTSRTTSSSSHTSCGRVRRPRCAYVCGRLNACAAGHRPVPREESDASVSVPVLPPKLLGWHRGRRRAVTCDTICECAGIATGSCQL